MGIRKTSNNKLSAIRNRSAAALPDRPTDKGMTSAQVKEAFVAPIIGTGDSSISGDNYPDSILGEINRIVDETNNMIDEIGYKIGDSPLQTSASTISSAINELHSGKQYTIDSSHKLSSDFVDDTNNTNLFVSSEEKSAWSAKQDALTFDAQPTANSQNPVTSEGIKTALNAKQDTIDSSHKLSSDMVDDTGKNHLFVTADEKSTWGGKQDTLTFDSEPTSSSTNPVTSGGVKAALDEKANASDVYTKTQVDAKMASAFHFKGSGTYSNGNIYMDNTLVSSPEIGDIYQITGTDKEYAWNGSSWILLGYTVDISGKQDIIDSSNKLSSDLVDDTNKTNKFVTASEKIEWTGKQDKIDSSHKLSSDFVDDTGKTNLFVTAAEKSTWSGKQNALTFDSAPTQNSTNPVTSGGIFSAINSAIGDINSILDSINGVVI